MPIVNILALVLLSGSGVTILDTSGNPVIGASLCTDSVLVGVTDLEGFACIPEGLETLQVRAMGYETWAGALPASRMITMESVPVPSGMVVTVVGSRGILREYFPATTSLGKQHMEFLGRSGLRGLMNLSGGVFVREYGGAMPVVSISVRGSDPAHSAYYVDGHDITSSMDGAPGLTLDPLVFGGMEVSRGSGSRHLRGGMAGTLNFLPETCTSPPEVSISAGDDGSGWLSGSLPAGSNRLSMSLRRNRGTAGTTGYSGTFLLSGMRNTASYGLLASVSAGETESPQWSLPTDGERERESLDCWARLTLGRFILSSGTRVGRHRYTSTVPDQVDDTHDELGSRFGAGFRSKVAGLEFGISSQLLLDKVRSTSIGSRGRVELETSLEAGYIGGISVSGSAALSAVPGSTALPGAGIMLGLPLPDSVLITHAGVSLGYRRPTLNDLYWPEDSFARGNPDLEPETSVEAEAGISLHTVQWTRASVTGFIGESRDLIRWEPGPGGKWTPVNVARVLRRGVEAEAWAETGPLEVSGTLTLLDVRDNDPGSVNYTRTLPYVPDYTWALGAGLELPRCCKWNLGVRGTGIRFTNYSETSWMPAYSIVSAGLSVRPAFLHNITVDFSADNIFNEEYQETSGFQGMGRILQVGLRWNGE